MDDTDNIEKHLITKITNPILALSRIKEVSPFNNHGRFYSPFIYQSEKSPAGIAFSIFLPL